MCVREKGRKEGVSDRALSDTHSLSLSLSLSDTLPLSIYMNTAKDGGVGRGKGRVSDTPLFYMYEYTHCMCQTNLYLTHTLLRPLSLSDTHSQCSHWMCEIKLCLTSHTSSGYIHTYRTDREPPSRTHSLSLSLFIRHTLSFALTHTLFLHVYV